MVTASYPTPTCSESHPVIRAGGYECSPPHVLPVHTCHCQTVPSESCEAVWMCVCVPSEGCECMLMPPTSSSLWCPISWWSDPLNKWPLSHQLGSNRDSRPLLYRRGRETSTSIHAHMAAYCLVSCPNLSSCGPFFGGWASTLATTFNPSDEQLYTSSMPLLVPTANIWRCGARPSTC